MRFHIITLFPTAFDSYLNESIIARAIALRKIKVFFYNPRDYSEDKWTKSARGGSSDQQRWFRRRIDQKPYSGGPGMVIQALPVIKAVEKTMASIKHLVSKKKGKKGKSKIKIIWLSPNGKQFDTAYAKKTAQKFTDIIIISGRYEGIDARVKKIFKTDDISIGPFVLTGGELPAMILVDCISRQVEGVLGNFNSLEESRISSHDVYTRPEVFSYLNRFDKNGRPIRKADLGKKKKYRVPKVLLSGDHKKIESWLRSH